MLHHMKSITPLCSICFVHFNRVVVGRLNKVVVGNHFENCSH